MKLCSLKIIYQLCIALIVLAVSTDSVALASEKGLVVINSITIKGNNTTNEKIILRELTFNEGDTLSYAELEENLTQSTHNLNNTLLFNFVTVIHNQQSNSVIVEVEERWYIWPFPVFEYSHRNLSAFFNDGDLSRVNYGAYIVIDNFRGLREQIKLRLVWGYRKQVRLQYFSHNLDKNKKHGISGLVSYYTNYEVPYQSLNNKPVYYFTNNGDARRVFHTSLTYRYRPKHNWHQSLTFGWIKATVADTVTKLNPNYFGKSSSNFTISEVKYETMYDKRNSKIFPLQGYFGRAEIARQGIFSNETISNWNVKLLAGYYAKISDRFYAGTDGLIQLNTQKNLPYYLNEAIGYGNYIRGMEYYTTNGSNYFINKNSFKFQLLKTKIIKLPLIPEGRFKKTHISLFWSIFADTGYVHPELNATQSDLEGKLLYGYGTGLNLFAYYDIVFRVEYSINLLGEKGFFIHFGTPFLNQ